MVFVLQGFCEQLVAAACFYAPPAFADVVARAADWLVSHHFVEFGPLDVVYKVASGAGMGSKSSGVLANAGFRQRFERHLMSQFAVYNVLGYVRYVDILLFHVASLENAHSFWHGFII